MCGEEIEGGCVGKKKRMCGEEIEGEGVGKKKRMCGEEKESRKKKTWETGKGEHLQWRRRPGARSPRQAGCGRTSRH